MHRELVDLSKAGNRKAQYQLYQLYAGAMYNICMRMLNNQQEAEDMLQESFTEAFIKLDSFRYDSTFGAWLKRIVVNKCINELKRRKAELVFTDTPLEPLGDDEQADYAQITLEVARIQKAMEQLADGYRVILSLYLLEGYDHTEIAQIMGISESTSKSQYMRAKKKILEKLKNQ